MTHGTTQPCRTGFLTGRFSTRRFSPPLRVIGSKTAGSTGGKALAVVKGRVRAFGITLKPWLDSFLIWSGLLERCRTMLMGLDMILPAAAFIPEGNSVVASSLTVRLV